MQPFWTAGWRPSDGRDRSSCRRGDVSPHGKQVACVDWLETISIGFFEVNFQLKFPFLHLGFWYLTLIASLFFLMTRPSKISKCSRLYNIGGTISNRHLFISKESNVSIRVARIVSPSPILWILFQKNIPPHVYTYLAFPLLYVLGKTFKRTHRPKPPKKKHTQRKKPTRVPKPLGCSRNLVNG